MAGYTIPAGEMTEQVQLQQRVAGVDALGQTSTTWADVGSPLWARVRAIAARDFAGADQAQASSTIRVEIRTGATVLASYRVWWDGRPWDIVGEPLPIDRTWIRFDAQSGVRDAR